MKTVYEIEAWLAAGEGRAVGLRRDGRGFAARLHVDLGSAAVASDRHEGKSRTLAGALENALEEARRAPARAEAPRCAACGAEKVDARAKCKKCGARAAMQLACSSHPAKNVARQVGVTAGLGTFEWESCGCILADVNLVDGDTVTVRDPFTSASYLYEFRGAAFRRVLRGAAPKV